MKLPSLARFPIFYLVTPGDSHDGGHGHSHDADEKGHGHSHDAPNSKQAEQLNMKGVFLHVLGDAVGSIVVVVSALLMLFFNNCPESPDYSTDQNCVIHQAASDCGDYLTQYFKNQYFIEQFNTGSDATVKNYVHNFLLQPNTTQSPLDPPHNVLVNANMTASRMFPQSKLHWTLYVDPITSLILTFLILYTTLQLLRGRTSFQIIFSARRLS